MWCSTSPNRRPAARSSTTAVRELFATVPLVAGVAVPDRDRLPERTATPVARARARRRATARQATRSPTPCDWRPPPMSRVVVVGTNDQWETEGEDRTSIDLPGRPGRTGRRGRRGEPEDRRRAELRFAGHDAMARRRGRGAADLVPRRAVRAWRWPTCCPATSSPADASPSRSHVRSTDTPAARSTQATATGRVRRRSARRVSLVRARGRRAAVPVRARARLHDVRHHPGRPVGVADRLVSMCRPMSSTPVARPGLGCRAGVRRLRRRPIRTCHGSGGSWAPARCTSYRASGRPSRSS